MPRTHSSRNDTHAHFGQQVFFSAAASFLPQAHLSHLQSAFFASAVQPHDSHLQASFFGHCEGHCAIATDTIIAAATAIIVNTVFMILILSVWTSEVRKKLKPSN